MFSFEWCCPPPKWRQVWACNAHGLGVIVGLLCCHFGLQVKSSPTEVPRMASRAVVTSLLGCVVFNTGLTAFFYYLVGPPIH